MADDQTSADEPAGDEPGGPRRTCVGCRAVVAQDELLRFVVAGDEIVADPARRAPGRGAYLHRDQGCLTLALRRRALPRALRTQAQPAADLAEAVAPHAKTAENG